MRNLSSKKEWALGIGFFLAGIALCALIPMSNGDDAYFSQMSHSTPLFDYLKMRYETWTGRMSSEAMTWIAFHFPRYFWEVMNAFMLTLLPLGMIRIIKKMGMGKDKSLFLTLAMYLGILLLSMEVIGYSAFWITGSTFYLWCAVPGLWACTPLADLVFGEKRPDWRVWIWSIPCAVIAAMGQEQIAPVVIAFGVITVVAYYLRKKRIPWGALLQTAFAIAGFAMLFLAPGNAIRTQEETTRWLPQFAALPTGNRIFLTVQWMLSGFANQSKMLLAILWIFCIFLLLKRGKEKNMRLLLPAGLAALVALLPYAGITWFSDMGMGQIDPAVPVTQVPTPASMNLRNWIAFAWWGLALFFTLYLLWVLLEKTRERIMSCLLFLASFACAALMYFSPTIYASGWRTFFMSQILLWLLIGILFVREEAAKQKWQLLLLLAAGVLNFISGASYMMSFLKA